MALTYAEYIEVDGLLNLQHVRSDPPEHDEMLFIIIHQTYELWFKLLLFEFAKICADFSHNELFGAIATFKRVRTIMKTLTAQLDILETMTPMSFTSFRDRLETSSGFQSTQFRELEYLMGFKRPGMLRFHEVGSPAYRTLQSRLQERSVVDHFYDFLEHRGTAIPKAVRTKDVAAPTLPDAAVQDEIHRLYVSHPDMAILFELMTDFDEGLQEWRYRHAKTVERTIGNKQGTGGSLGVEYLKQTLFIPVFPDLWAIRHRF